MKIINQPWRPRRTALTERVRRAAHSGKEKILLRTAVEVYGAYNIIYQFKKLLNVNAAVRRINKSIFLFVNPKERSKLARNRKLHGNHIRMRRALSGLQRGECLEINTPLEAHAFQSLRQALKKDGMQLRTVRNCSSVLVWHDIGFPTTIEALKL